MKPRDRTYLKHYFKIVLYLIVFSLFSVSHAGSYDDFFTAIKRDDADTIRSLLSRGFDPNTLDPAGEHGLILAVRGPATKSLELLIASPGIKVEVRTAQDESPLMLASLKGLTGICQLLIEKGADVNKPGWAPLHYAATNGHLAVMHLLLEHHAYIDAGSPNGSTPLMMASRYGSAAAVKLLLEAGADPMLKNDLGMSAIDFAQSVSRQDVAELIASFVRSRQGKGSW